MFDAQFNTCQQLKERLKQEDARTTCMHSPLKDIPAFSYERINVDHRSKYSSLGAGSKLTHPSLDCLEWDARTRIFCLLPRRSQATRRQRHASTTKSRLGYRCSLTWRDISMTTSTTSFHVFRNAWKKCDGNLYDFSAFRKEKHEIAIYFLLSRRCIENTLLWNKIMRVKIIEHISVYLIYKNNNDRHRKHRLSYLHFFEYNDVFFTFFDRKRKINQYFSIFLLRYQGV